MSGVARTSGFVLKRHTGTFGKKEDREKEVVYSSPYSGKHKSKLADGTTDEFDPTFLGPEGPKADKSTSPPNLEDKPDFSKAALYPNIF